MSSFSELKLIEPLLNALRQTGYTQPTPIQAQSIPILLQGKDLLGCAQTGTGKTAAFSLPILQKLTQSPSPSGQKNVIRALVLAPTRELAIQIGESFRDYGKFLPLRHTVIFGGVNQNPQVAKLKSGVDILIATPGRLLDLMGQGFIKLDKVEIFVLDEADRMLDMGFIVDIRKIVPKLPAKRQSIFLSATMPPEILKLTHAILHQPESVSVAPVSSTAETVGQSVYFVEKTHKNALLLHLLQDSAIQNALLFTRTKHGANKVAKHLVQAGIRAEAIHGNKSQAARQKALENFKGNRTRVLVATDIAARGIDVDSLSHVINFDMPNVPETYVHRIGRTGRAGASGKAISFCDIEERLYLRDIHKLIGKSVDPIHEHPYASPIPHNPTAGAPQPNAAIHQNRSPGGFKRRKSKWNR